MTSGTPYPQPTGVRGWWAQRSPLARALLILASVALIPLFLCCGGGAMVSALTADPPATERAAPSTTPASTAPASRAPVTVTRTITETEPIPFEEEVVEDPSLLAGTEEVRTEGVAGELTITYEVTFVDGVETDRRKIDEEVTREPVNELVAVGTGQPEPEPEPEPEPDPEPDCHPGYSGACVPTGVSDVDCAGGSGNGPAYVRGPVYVEGSDPYDLDRDGDGVACE